MTRPQPQFAHEQIFQSEPKPWLRKTYPLNGWTETISGYQNEAHRLSCCICRNLKYQSEPYRWRLTIHFHREMSVSEIKEVWVAACRKMQRHGVVAFWTREPTANNRCHYHLIVTRPVTKEALAEAVEASLPDRKELRWHKHIRLMRSPWWWSRYILKAKVGGFVKGRFTTDRWARKRLLFRPKLGLNKHRTIGDFWARKPDALWEEICAIEARIREGLERPGVKEVVKLVHELVGDAVSERHVERQIGFWAYSGSLGSYIDLDDQIEETVWLDFREHRKSQL